MIRFNWKLAAACLLLVVAASACLAAPIPKNDGKDHKANAIQRAQSQNNLKQILIAMHNYHDANGHFPQNVTDKNGKPLLSWRVLLLPYIEEEKLYEQFKLDEPWDSEHNKKPLAQMPRIFRVGIEPDGETKTYYQGFAGPGTAFEPGQKIKVPNDFPDGAARTLVVVEAGPPVEWTKPADIAYDRKNPLPKLEGPFSNVLVSATADGAVHNLRRDIDAKNLRRLIETNDGERVDLDDLRGTFPLTAEDLEVAKKFIEQNEQRMGDMLAELKEQQKLLLELAKQSNGKDADKRLDELSKMHLEMTFGLAALKKRTEELKQQLEDVKREQAKPKK